MMSETRKVYAMFADKLKTGEKQAILVPSVISDACRLKADEAWQSSEDLLANTMVAAVKHMGRYETKPGDRLAVYDDLTWAFTVYVRVRKIHRIKNRELSAKQVTSVGFPSVAAYHEDENLPGGWGWLLDVEPETQS